MLEALWHGVWLDNSFPGRAIVAILGILLTWALRSGMRHVKRYGRESGALALAKERLRSSVAPKPVDSAEIEGATGEVEVAEDARHVSPVDLEEIRKALDPASLISQRFEAIEKLRTREVRVNPTALQQLSLAYDEAQPGMAVPGAVAGLSVMLGLLGTFIGLAVMVQQIQFVLPQGSGQVTVDSWAQSVENIGTVLGGIKTAFSASLVGIVVSIAASILDLRLRTAQARYFEDLERFTTVDLLPLAVPAVEDESLLERVSLQLQRSFTALDEVFRLNQDALKEMTGAQRAFVDIVDEVRKITRSEASRNLEAVLEQIGLANRSVLSLTEQLPKVVSAVESGQRRLLDRLGSMLSSSPTAVPGISPASSRLSLPVMLVLLAVGAALVFILNRS